MLGQWEGHGHGTLAPRPDWRGLCEDRWSGAFPGPGHVLSLSGPLELLALHHTSRQCAP